jgi:predicted nucleic acid-binding protein
MDRLFLDANVLFSAAYKKDARVARLWTLKNTSLFTSRYALEEARFNLEEEEQQGRLVTLARALRLVEGPDRPLPRGISLPEKDQPILLAALEARAHYLLTGDVRHFGIYFGKTIEELRIILPSQYLNLRNRLSER